jgi:hypothetical protein
MMQETRSGRTGNGVLWGTSIGSFLIFLVMERRLFMRYVNETELQLAVVGILFGATMLSIFGGRALSTRWLALAIFTSAVILALSWFLLFYDLAPVELDNENAEMWWALYLQIVMMTVQIAVLPILLIEWTRRCSAVDMEGRGRDINEAGLTTVAVIVAGSVAGAAGLLSEFGDRWSVLVGCIASAATAVCTVAVHGHAMGDPGRDRIANKPGASDANLFFRDAMVTLLIGIPGFSMMARDAFQFPTLSYTGASLAAFGVVYALVSHVRRQPGALAVLEGNLIALFVACTWMMIYLYMHGMTADLVSGLPEFIIGFALGYFWTRVMHVGEGIPYPKGFPDIPRRGVGQDATGKLVAFLHVFLLGVSVAFAINAGDPETIKYVYPAALAIAGVDMLLWTISALRHKA